MTEYAITHPVSRGKLDANAVLSEAWRLYKRLFARSVLMGAIVFGVVEFVGAFADSGGNQAWLGFATILLSVAGVAFLQGGLVEIVHGLHADGDDDISVAEAFHRAGGRVWKLTRVSALTGMCVGLASLLFVVPGIVLMTWWAVAVPVAMLEKGSPRDAMRRSRAIVDGNGWSVFKVLFACAVLTALVRIPLVLVGAGLGPFGRWIVLTLALSLTAPFAAHAFIVVYYTLVAPERPVALEPGRRWESVWSAQEEIEPPAPMDPKTETLDEEYARKFDERSKQWGG